MTLNNVDKLGKELGKIVSAQDSIKENISPDEAVDQDQIVSIERLPIGCNFTINKHFYPTDSFILDHPVYGDIDSATLKLDGGYATSIGGFTFPGTFPMTFAFISAASEVAFTSQF